MSDKEYTVKAALEELYPVLDHHDWRIIGAITEEAGEIQGAFNKWQGDTASKIKTKEDVIEETVQCMACCIILLYHYKITSGEAYSKVIDFMYSKAAQIRTIRSNYEVAMVE